MVDSILVIMAKFEISQCDKRKLFFQGYGYNFHKTTKNFGDRWTCDRRTICKAYAFTQENAEDGAGVVVNGLHSHDPNPSRFEITQVR